MVTYQFCVVNGKVTMGKPRSKGRGIWIHINMIVEKNIYSILCVFILLRYLQNVSQANLLNSDSNISP